jgi:steroid delta-isomerase-like uncharacterized protein
MTTSTGRPANKQLVRRAFTAWDACDETAIGSLVTPDFIQHNQEGGFWDAAEIVRLLRLFRTSFPDRHTEIQRMAAEDDLVAAHWITNATHRGPYLDVLPTGTKVRAEGVAFFRIEDGRIAEVWNWSTSPGFYKQITGRSAPIRAVLDRQSRSGANPDL